MIITDVAFTSYAVTDLRRARRFYETILGLIPSRIVGDDEKGSIEYGIGSAALVVTNRMSFFHPSPNGGLAVLEVADLDTAVAELRAAGVRFVTEPFETPVCRAAVVSDPDGNSIGLHRRK
jgi:predicted enzyme related to lactoylglutathione lyase